MVDRRRPIRKKLNLSKELLIVWIRGGNLDRKRWADLRSFVFKIKCGELNMR